MHPLGPDRWPEANDTPADIAVLHYPAWASPSHLQARFTSRGRGNGSLPSVCRWRVGVDVPSSIAFARVPPI
eukprot:2433183-Lingulodinium_polyedra.AAC.1